MSARAPGILTLDPHFRTALLLLIAAPALAQGQFYQGQFYQGQSNNDPSSNAQRKTEIETRKITAMSAAPTARDIISATMANQVSIPRMELVRERKEMNLNYGSLFIARQLVNSGADITEITQRLKTGKTIWQVAAEHNTDWRSVASATKKLNSKIQDSIYKYFLHPEVGKQRALTENYNPEADLVPADLDTTREEVQAAHDEYVLWRNRAAATSGHPLDASSEDAINKDLEVFKGTQRPH
jgi:hypothetical protein